MLGIPSTCDSMRYFVVLLQKAQSYYRATYHDTIVGVDTTPTVSLLEARRRLYSCLYMAFAGATISRGVWFKVKPTGNRLTHGDTKDTGQGATQGHLRKPAARFIMTELLPTLDDPAHTAHMNASYNLFAEADPSFADGTSDIPHSTPIPRGARPPDEPHTVREPHASSSNESTLDANVFTRDLVFQHLYGPSSNANGVSPPPKVTALTLPLPHPPHYGTCAHYDLFYALTTYRNIYLPVLSYIL